MSEFEFKTKSNKLPNSASIPATKSLYGATAFEPASTVMPPLQLRESPFYSPHSPLMPQRKVKNPAAVQLSEEAAEDVKPETIHQAAATGVQGTGSKLPYLEKIQQSFGRFNVSHVQAYPGSFQAAAASKAMGAEAYAVGSKVAFKDTNPSLHTAAHEAAHIIQQRSGVQLKSGVGEPGDAYEQQADRVADAVVQGRSAEHLLGIKSNAVIGNQVQRAVAVQMMFKRMSDKDSDSEDEMQDDKEKNEESKKGRQSSSSMDESQDLGKNQKQKNNISYGNEGQGKEAKKVDSSKGKMDVSEDSASDKGEQPKKSQAPKGAGGKKGRSKRGNKSTSAGDDFDKEMQSIDSKDEKAMEGDNSDEDKQSMKSKASSNKNSNEEEQPSSASGSKSKKRKRSASSDRLIEKRRKTAANRSLSVSTEGIKESEGDEQPSSFIDGDDFAKKKKQKQKQKQSNKGQGKESKGDEQPSSSSDKMNSNPNPFKEEKSGFSSDEEMKDDRSSAAKLVELYDEFLDLLTWAGDTVWRELINEKRLKTLFSNYYLTWVPAVEDTYQDMQSTGKVGKKEELSYNNLMKLETQIEESINKLFPLLNKADYGNNKKNVTNRVMGLVRLIKKYMNEAQKGFGLSGEKAKESKKYAVDEKAKKNPDDYHFGTESDPIPIIWYKNLTSYKPIELTPAAAKKNRGKKEIGFPEKFTLEHDEKKYSFGVDEDNIPEIGYKELKKTKHDSKRKEQRKLNDVINANTDNMLTEKGLDGDHVKDLGFGGEDEIDNYWPLKNTINRRAFTGYNRNYAVHYKKKEDDEDIVKIAPVGFLYDKWFEVKDHMEDKEGSYPKESGTADAGKNKKNAGNSNASNSNASNSNASKEKIGKKNRGKKKAGKK